MKLRAIILLLLLAVTVFLTSRERGSARWNSAENWSLDFLLANARGQFERNEVAPSGDVVLVEFAAKDKAEFSAWPPAPLDYLMVLKRLATHEPEIVAFADLMKWSGEPKDGQELQKEALSQQLVVFPSVVLAALATSGETAGARTADDDLALLEAGVVDGAPDVVAKLGSIELPDAALRTQMPLGFVLRHDAGAKDGDPLSFIAQGGNGLVPSLAARVVSLHEKTIDAATRLRFGVGAEMHFGSGRFVPLAHDGSARPMLRGGVTRLSAVDVATPDLGDESSKALAEKIGIHKIIVLGTDESGGAAQARAIAWALSLPVITRAPEQTEWIVVALTALLTLWQLRFGRFAVLVFGAALVILLLGLAMVVFQSTLLWCAPGLPLAVVACGTLFCFVWPRVWTASVSVTDTPVY